MTTRERTHLEVPSLVETLHRALREEILTGAVPGGATVTEVALAERYSVARPTAKAALERMVQDGLLQRSTNKAARVPLLGVADVRDIYWTRGLLEREVIAALALGKGVPQEAYHFIRDLEDCIDAPELDSVVTADIGFHRALVGQLKSPRLTKLYGSLMGEVHLCMAQVQAHRLLHPTDIMKEHIAIARAIEAGDGEEAVKEIGSHLDSACERLVAYLVSDGGNAKGEGTPLPIAEARRRAAAPR